MLSCQYHKPPCKGNSPFFKGCARKLLTEGGEGVGAAGAALGWGVPLLHEEERPAAKKLAACSAFIP